jgi:hypothetical protein
VTPMEVIRHSVRRFGGEASNQVDALRAVGQSVTKATAALDKIAGTSEQPRLVAARAHLAAVPPTLDEAATRVRAAAGCVREYGNRIF